MIINLGLIGFSWKGEYVPTETYTENDIVEFNGTSYIVTASSINGVTPVEGNDYSVFSEGTSRVSGNDGELIYNNNGVLTTLPAGEVGDNLIIDANGNPSWGTPAVRSGLKAYAIMPTTNNSYRKGFCLMTDGTMRAWGRGENWQLGQGNNTQDRSYPITTAFPYGTADIVDAYMSYDQASMALDADGKFWAWGQNDHGYTGGGNTSDTYMPYCASDNSSNSLYGKIAIDFVKLGGAVNILTSMVLCSDGTVHGCGYNGYGQLGMGDTSQRTNFNQVPLLADIIQIAGCQTQYTSYLAVKNDGTLYSWGRNNEGQLGHGNTTQYNIPQAVSYFVVNNISIIKANRAGYCSWAIDSDHNLYTWGYNGYGNLGNGSTSQTNTPQLVLTNVETVEMSRYDSSYNYTYAIKRDGTLWSTGDNTYGCLGVATDTTDRSSFTQCRTDDNTFVTGITKVAPCSAGGSYNYVLALDENGVAWSVGYSGNGQLGRGTWDATNYYFQPVKIHKGKVTDIATFGKGSEGASMFLMENGSVMVSGYAGESQLPEDDDESCSIPFSIMF